MLLERTILQLDTGRMPADRAHELGQMGYMQWLVGLPGNADYHHAARAAHARALPFAGSSDAVAVFCALLTASLQMPPRPLPLSMPRPQRRGGARARRLAL